MVSVHLSSGMLMLPLILMYLIITLELLDIITRPP